MNAQECACRQAEHENLMQELMTALESCLASLERADIREGYCCCGSDMERHDDPMSCGHSPIDAGEYYTGQIMEEARKVLKKAKGQ